MMLRERGYLSMKGGVYTKEKCPVCHGRFQHTEKDLLCPTHQTKPNRYFIHLYDKVLGRYVNIYSDARGIPFSSYEQANRILTKIRAEIDAGTYDSGRYVAQKLKPLQFRNWATRWFEDRKKDKEMSAISPSYLKELNRFVRIFVDLFGDTDIRDIGNRQIADFYRSLGPGYSPKSQSNILGCLHKIFRDAQDYGDIGLVPKFPKVDIPERDFDVIDLDTQDQVINSITDLMDKAYLLFTARQMVRPSETRALWWSDLDFKHGRVKIQRHFSLQQVKPTTKSKRIKILPLDAEVRDTLMKLPRHITCPFVFQKNGKCYSESYARKLWNRTCAQLGVKIIFYQGTRHSSITAAVARAGYDDVQEFVGHTRRDMTKRYGKPNVDRLKRVLRNHD